MADSGDSLRRGTDSFEKPFRTDDRRSNESRQEACEPQVFHAQAIHLSSDEVVAQELEHRSAFPVMGPLSLERRVEPGVPAIPPETVEISVDILELGIDLGEPLQAVVAAAGAGLVPGTQPRQPLRQFLRGDIQLQSLDHGRRLFLDLFDTARSALFGPRAPGEMTEFTPVLPSTRRRVP